MGWCWLAGLLCAPVVRADAPAVRPSPALAREASATPHARVVVVRDPEATDAYEARPERVLALVHSGLTNFTGQPTPAAAWRSLVSTQDIVGLKVYSAPGAKSGTRPAVVAAVIEGLLAAGLPPTNIVVWDKHRADLRLAGFYELAEKYGVRVESSAAAGYDEKTFYEKSIVGQLVWGDLEFGRQAEGVGRKSFVSKLVTHDLSKIVNLTPLLNHNSAGVTGNLFSLALGSVDNTLRFETDPGRLADAVPEIYALRAVGDRVVLNLVDALICQYQGEQRGLLHYSKALNEIRLSKDPVALDVLSFHELDRQRQAFDRQRPVAKNNLPNYGVELLQNAALLELGVSDTAHIQVERVP